MLQGNRFLWGYDESMDPELQEVFNLVVRSGINVFDTADSYGTGRLNGELRTANADACMAQFGAATPGTCMQLWIEASMLTTK